MPYNFEQFSGAGSKFDDRVTITRIGSFGVLSGFVKIRLKSAFPKYMELFYDREVRAIAFRFSDEKKSSISFSVVKTGKRGDSGSVSARSFFRTYDLDPDKINGKYDVQEVDDVHLGKLFVIQLPQV